MVDNETSALLTPKQRQYLMGDSDIEEKSAEERMIRSRIRNRLSASMLDMVLLQHELEPRDLEKAFDLDETDHIRKGIGLMLRAAFHSRVTSPGYGVSDDTEPNDEETLAMLESYLTMGVESFYGYYEMYKPGIEVTIDLPEDEKLVHALNKGLFRGQSELDDQTIDRLAHLPNERLIHALKEDLITEEVFESVYEKGENE